MQLPTKHFGTIDIEEDKILSFADGLPGFPECRRFFLLHEIKDEPQEDEGLFSWLQSVDDGDVAFALMDVYMVMPQYDPQVSNDDLAELGECADEDLLVYNIAVIPEDINDISVNLKAPVLINAAQKKGRQVVAANETYEVRHRIMDELKKNAEKVG